jgi:hypothetical protein
MGGSGYKLVMKVDCAAFREAHPAGLPGGAEHLAACPECRAFAASWELLREYPPIPASPDFLRGIRRKLAPRILRFAAPLAAAAAVLLLSVVLFLQPPPKPASAPVTELERELVENLELLQNFELARTYELVVDAEERK